MSFPRGFHNQIYSKQIRTHNNQKSIAIQTQDRENEITEMKENLEEPSFSVFHFIFSGKLVRKLPEQARKFRLSDDDD